MPDRLNRIRMYQYRTLTRIDFGSQRTILLLVLSKVLMAAVIVLSAVAVQAHPMGRSVPIAYTGSDITQARLAAQVIASYFEEQMGCRIVLVMTASIPDLFEHVATRKAPMAVVPAVPADEVPEDVVIIPPGLDTGVGIFDLVMGTDAMKDLQLSLVPRYMELLSSSLDHNAWAKGSVMVNNGEGVRKVALEMLREADLL